MGTKKIAFEIPVSIPQSEVKSIVSYAEVYLQEECDIKVKLKDNPAFMEMVKKGITESMKYAVESLYGDEVIDHDELKEMFKEQIDAAEAKRLAKEEAEEMKAYAKRIKTAGVMRMHPDDLEQAVKVLKAAGIEVTV